MRTEFQFNIQKLITYCVLTIITPKSIDYKGKALLNRLLLTLDTTPNPCINKGEVHNTFINLLEN